MTGPDAAVMLLLALAVLYMMYGKEADRRRCYYCGEAWGHDVHCPRKDIV